MGQRAGDGVSARRGSKKEADENTISANDFKATSARRAATTEPVIEATEVDVTVVETRQDIERTRAHMEQTLGAIGDKLSPERFKAEAVDAAGKLKEDAIQTADHFKEAAVEAARAATQEVIGGVKTATREVYDGARNRVLHTTNEIKGAGMTVIDTLKQNPIPTAMVGLGLYWLAQGLEQNKRISYRRRLGGLTYVGEEREYRTYPVTESRDYAVTETRDYSAMGGIRTEGIRDRVDGMRDRAEETIGDVRDKVGDVADRVSSKAHDLTGSIQESAARLKRKAGRRIGHVQERAHDGLVEMRGMVYTNPLAVAGMAALAGIAMGLMLPDTELENETLGYTRDRLVDQAQEKVGEIQQKAVELKDKAVDVARETATVAVDTLAAAQKASGLKDKAADVVRETAAVAADSIPTPPEPAVGPVVTTEITIEKTVTERPNTIL